MGDVKNVCSVVVGRCKLRWGNTITVELKKIRHEGRLAGRDHLTEGRDLWWVLVTRELLKRRRVS
jgi:hypothetical protein